MFTVVGYIYNSIIRFAERAGYAHGTAEMIDAPTNAKIVG